MDINFIDMGVNVSKMDFLLDDGIDSEALQAEIESENRKIKEKLLRELLDEQEQKDSTNKKAKRQTTIYKTHIGNTTTTIQPSLTIDLDVHGSAIVEDMGREIGLQAEKNTGVFDFKTNQGQTYSLIGMLGGVVDEIKNVEKRMNDKFDGMKQCDILEMKLEFFNTILKTNLLILLGFLLCWAVFAATASTFVLQVLTVLWGLNILYSGNRYYQLKKQKKLIDSVVEE